MSRITQAPARGDYTVRLTNDRLFLNGVEVRDLLDFDNRTYTITRGPLPLVDIIARAFTAGRRSARRGPGASGGVEFWDNQGRVSRPRKEGAE